VSDLQPSMKIKTDMIRIVVNDDPNRVVKFNPSDVLFAEKFYNLLDEFKTELGKFSERAKEIEKVTAKDAEGIPLNTGAKLSLTVEFCNYMDAKIESLFGPGTCAAAFDGTKEIDMYEQFFEGIMPFIQKARKDKIQKYTNPATEKKNKRNK
jgi:hypothetical protein